MNERRKERKKDFILKERKKERKKGPEICAAHLLIQPSLNTHRHLHINIYFCPPYIATVLPYNTPCKKTQLASTPRHFLPRAWTTTTSKTQTNPPQSNAKAWVFFERVVAGAHAHAHALGFRLGASRGHLDPANIYVEAPLPLPSKSTLHLPLSSPSTPPSFAMLCPRPPLLQW